jgi:hypothetical protein
MTFRILTALFLILVSAGCLEETVTREVRLRRTPSEGLFDQSAGSVESMAIRPAFVKIEGLGKTVQLLADVRLEDGTYLKDRTESVLLVEGERPIEWATDNFGIATVDSKGLVTSVSSGETMIRARMGETEAAARVVVESPTSLDPSIDTTDYPPGEEPPAEESSESPPPTPEAPYADRVVSYTKGTNGGFNEGELPDIVLGPPKGRGPFQGSFDVFSLGVGGEILLEFTDYLIFDGAGVDFTVFENAFQVGDDPENTFAEPAYVAVSEDGVTFVEFPCDPLVRPYAGCAGVRSVLANPDLNDIDPTDPAVSGGDSFDLAQVGLRTARFVRIRDSGVGYGPIGPATGGFDLDAVAIVHGTLP